MFRLSMIPPIMYSYRYNGSVKYGIEFLIFLFVIFDKNLRTSYWYYFLAARTGIPRILNAKWHVKYCNWFSFYFYKQSKIENFLFVWFSTITTRKRNKLWTSRYMTKPFLHPENGRHWIFYF